MRKEKLLNLLQEIEKEKRKNRYFEKISYEEFLVSVKKYNSFIEEEKIIVLYNNLLFPCRSTTHAGGYDFYAPYDFVLKPHETLIVPTGFKVHMNDNETLNIFVRSSSGFKYNVRLSNQVGIIDSDYYNNISNEGHILLSFTNHGEKEWVNSVKDKAKIAQGIFMNYYLTRDDNFVNVNRKGGFGSTNEGEGKKSE